MRTHVELVIDGPREDKLAEAIAATAAGEVTGHLGDGATPASFVGIFYDPKVAGESSCRPHLRVPNLRQGHIRKLISSTLKVKDPNGDVLTPGDLYFIFDAGKAGSPN